MSNTVWDVKVTRVSDGVEIDRFMTVNFERDIQATRDCIGIDVTFGATEVLSSEIDN
jgi:hypothetical protein